MTSPIIAMRTADVGDCSMWTTHSGGLPSSDYARVGTYAFKLGLTDYLQQSVPSSATLSYTRVALLAKNAGSPHVDLEFREGSGTTHVTVRVDWVAGSITVYRGGAALGTVLQTYSVSLQTAAWYVLEVQGTVANSGGTVTVRLDGTVLTPVVSGVDTRDGGAAGVCDNLYLGRVPSGASIYVDDVILRTDDWPGLGSIYMLVPTGPGTNSAWDASSGDAYACVNTFPVTFAKYIYSHSDRIYDFAHDFAFSNLPDHTYDYFGGIGVAAFARLSEAGSASYIVTESDGVTGLGGDHITLAGTSGQWGIQYFQLDALGNPFTEIAVNDLVCGVEMR